MIKNYLENVLYALDVLINTMVFFGDPRETMSARMGRNISQGKCKLCKGICRFLDLFQKDHCLKAHTNESYAGDKEL